MVEKRKNSDIKQTTAIGTQISVKCSNTNSEKKLNITPQSSLALKGSSVPISEHKKTKSDPAMNSNNNNKKLNNDSSHMNDQLKAKKKRKKSKRSSRKCNPYECPRNSEAGSSKNTNQKNNSSKRSRLMSELRFRQC